MNNAPIRLVQLIDEQNNRKVALVQEPSLVLLEDVSSVYMLALEAINQQLTMNEVILSHPGDTLLDYTSVYNGLTGWKFLPSFDHPENPMNCMVSGTGLTHKNSALNRQMMHQSGNEKPTDSMQIYQWGLEGGFPQQGSIGVQPEWFYKGNGSMLKGHGETLEVPPFANDGGEEPEIAGVYIIDAAGKPWRIGFTTANEFSDHIMEKKNYLYLAPSKLRSCSIGPELVIGTGFAAFEGTVKITRNQEPVWSAAVHTGETNMAHSLDNLEYHHFKYPGHRIPFQAHIHFFGADAFSFGNNIALQDDDTMEIYWQGLGRPLRNTITIAKKNERPVVIESLQ